MSREDFSDDRQDPLDWLVDQEQEVVNGLLMHGQEGGTSRSC
jgi:hypothetical protein